MTSAARKQRPINRIPLVRLLAMFLKTLRYREWLNEVDRKIARAARANLARGYTFRAAFDEGLTPSQAIVDAINYLLAR
jgi:hypothetical protein